MYLNTLNKPSRRSTQEQTLAKTGFTRRKSDPESRRRRQAWYDKSYLDEKLAEINKKYKKSDYLVLHDPMTYEEAMDKCHEQVWQEIDAYLINSAALL